MLAGSHITASDWPGPWKGFKTAAGGSRCLMMMQASDNQLVADLASDQARKRPPDLRGSGMARVWWVGVGVGGLLALGAIIAAVV